MSIGAIASGPSLALFTMGMLIPWINAKVGPCPDYANKYVNFITLHFTF